MKRILIDIALDVVGIICIVIITQAVLMLTLL